ncbi:MAG: ArsR/SmtB family transcription factor [Anaerofustis sp.]
MVKAVMFKALGDNTRIEIIQLLAQGELCANEIHEHFEFSQPTLSYHMKMLTESGLVRARRDGAWVRYSLNRDAMSMLSNWIREQTESQMTLSEMNCASEEDFEPLAVGMYETKPSRGVINAEELKRRIVKYYELS